MNLSLDQFTEAVNKLADAKAKRMNAEHRAGKRLFGASHVAYPVQMMKFYHERGLTPSRALSEILAGQ